MMHKCTEMTELATDYMEGRASMSTGAMIKLHLMMCEHCANYYAQLEQVRVAAGNADADPTSANIDALTSRFKEWHDRQPKD